MINFGLLIKTKVLAICIIVNFSGVVKAQDCVQPPTGMVGWWPFDGNTEEIVLGHNGILQGGIYNSGMVLEGYQSQNYSTFVEVPDHDDLDLGAEFSIDAWVKIDALNADNMAVVWKGNQYGTDITSPYALLVMRNAIPDAGKVAVIIGDGSNSQLILSNSALSLQTQYLIAVVSDGQNVSIYINGVLDKTEMLTVIPYNSAYPLQIGGVKNLASYKSNYFNGVIDEVEIFNTAISIDDILSIYNAGSSGKCKDELAIPDIESDARIVNVRLYPNPAKESVTLEVDDNVFMSYTSVKLQIIDSQGRLIEEIDQINSVLTKVDIQELNEGIYVFQLSGNDTRIGAGRLVK